MENTVRFDPVLLPEKQAGEMDAMNVVNNVPAWMNRAGFQQLHSINRLESDAANNQVQYIL